MACFKRLFILFLLSTIACAQYIPVYAKLTDGTGNETVYGDLSGLGPFLLVRECRAALLSRGSQA
jgi:hypothetical protein